MRISDWSSDVCSSDRIERYFAPLAAKADGTFGLHNDAAVLPVGPGERLVATVDTMIAGRHFLDCPPDLVARKLLRVNLSDLAAMGARPFGYLLASARSEEHTSELQSLMRISYAGF